MVRRFYTFLVCIVIGATAQGYPTPFDLNGHVPRWQIDIDNPLISYEVLSDADVFSVEFIESIIDLSAEKWSAVPGSFLRLQEVNSQADITIFLKNSIANQEISSGFATFDGYSAAGFPNHCTIEILVEQTIGFLSIAKTILHEIGHCIGLGHSLIPQAIMSYNLDKNSFNLDLDDQAAVSRLYSVDHAKAKLPPGCAIGDYEQRDAPHLLWFLLAIICSFVFLRSKKTKAL